MNPLLVTIPRTGARGFTLAETLIVLLLLITLSAVLAPLLTASPARQVKAAASEVATALRETRRAAQASQQRRSFLLDTSSGMYRAGTDERGRLPIDGLSLSLTTAESLVDSDDKGRIAFFPDGSSSGGRITISRDDWTARVDVEWLLGRIRVSGTDQ